MSQSNSAALAWRTDGDTHWLGWPESVITGLLAVDINLHQVASVCDELLAVDRSMGHAARGSSWRRKAARRGLSAPLSVTAPRKRPPSAIQERRPNPSTERSNCR